MSSHIHIIANGQALQGTSIFSQSTGFDDYTDLVGFYQDSQQPHSSGLARGSAVIGALTFVKHVDAISPRLQRALRENQRIDARIRILRTTDQGNLQPEYEITLTNARMIGLRLELQQASIQEHIPALERVTILPAQQEVISLTTDVSDVWNMQND